LLRFPTIASPPRSTASGSRTSNAAVRARQRHPFSGKVLDGDLESVELFLLADQSPTTRCGRGSALDDAISQKRVDVARTLIEAGADVNEKASTHACRGALSEDGSRAGNHVAALPCPGLRAGKGGVDSSRGDGGGSCRLAAAGRRELQRDVGPTLHDRPREPSQARNGGRNGAPVLGDRDRDRRGALATRSAECGAVGAAHVGTLDDRLHGCASVQSRSAPSEERQTHGNAHAPGEGLHVHLQLLSDPCVYTNRDQRPSRSGDRGLNRRRGICRRRPVLRRALAPRHARPAAQTFRLGTQSRAASRRA